jgi:type IV pilus assembly protein PilB
MIHTDNESLIHFINQTINSAADRNASDIHFEPYETHCRVRCRQDGLLYEMGTLPCDIAKRLMIRLKIMSKLDISEQRLPQDGRFKIQLSTDHHIDIRTSTCPTLYGEKIVLRLLNQQNTFREIDKLGLNTQQFQTFLKAIHKPQGLVLVTGPTGSGKTSTLYAALAHLNSTEKNIVTIEDPVEINLDGINQVNVNLKSGLTFSRTLRSFLRQDPDIILIGEIRDTKTAEIAMKAAQTGHLVFSTLHTNRSYETFCRLYHLGIAPYQIASTLTLITAQRLVRKLCPHCKKEDILHKTLQEKMGVNHSIFKADGCKHCMNGYNGRIAIHELLQIPTTILNTLLQKNDLQALLTIKNQPDFFDLEKSAFEKVFSGETSLDEIYRVL